MRVVAQVWGPLKELVGASAVAVEVPLGATPRALLQALVAAHPAAAAVVSTCIVAVGDEYADLDAPLPPGAELSVIPPVSGG